MSNVSFLGQTFPVSQDTQCDTIQIMYKTPPSVDPLFMVTETIAGFPDLNRVLSSITIDHKTIVSDSPLNIVFNDLMYFRRNSLYSFVICAYDKDGSVYVAELGKEDLSTREYITQNAFPAGALVYASQASSFSVSQSEDMYIKVFKKSYNPGDSDTIFIGNIDVENCTDIMVSTPSTVHAGTSVEYSFKMLDEPKRSIRLESQRPYFIDSYTGKFEVLASLKTNNSDFSPEIDKNIQISHGTVNLPITYISRSFSSNKGSTIRVYLNTKEPSGSSTKIFYQNSNNDWVQIQRENDYIPVEIGSGLVEYAWKADNINVESTRVKIEMDSASPVNRPTASSLRVVFS